MEKEKSNIELNDKFRNINDFNDLTDAALRDIFDDIDFDIQKNKIVAEDNKDLCPKCNKTNCIVEDMVYSILVCTNCGQVTGNLVDQNPEWRQFEDDNKNESRCSMPVNKLLPQSSLGTSIAGNFKSRLKTLHTWSQMPYKERSLNTVFKIIQSKCQKGNIVKCIEDDAKIMYKSISECKHVKGKNKGKFIIIRGTNRQSLIAACVFFACRRNGKTRSPKEIADLFDLKYTEITKGCKNFLRLMKIRKLGINIGTSQPEHFVTRFCNELKIKKQYIDQAVQISKNIRKLNIASVHTPFSTATSSILLMAELNDLRSISKKKLSNKFKVSEVTITKTYRKIEQYKRALIDDKMTDKLVKMIDQNKQNDKIPNTVLERFKKFDMEPVEKNGKVDKIIEHNKDIENAVDNSNSSDSNYEEYSEYDDFEDIDDLEDLDNNVYNFNMFTSIDPILSKKIDINDDIEEYVDNINLEIYEQMAATEKEYNACLQYNLIFL